MTVGIHGRTGRRPGSTSSRNAILDAARDQFTRHGFKGATVRAVAAQAGVDPALIRHFFGGKDGLFAASMEVPVDAFDAVTSALDGPPDGWGAALARAYLDVWEDPDTSAPLRATVVSAFANEEAMTHFRDHLMARVLVRLAPRLPQDAPEFRFAMAITHVAGVALARHLLHAPPVVAARLDDIVDTIAPSIQAYLTGPLPESMRVAGGPSDSASSAGDTPTSS